MMIPGVVRNDDNASTASGAGSLEFLEKQMERHGVKLSLLSKKNKFPVPHADSAKVADAPPRRMVQQHGVGLFRWNPHQTTRPMLLEVDLIGGPQINARIAHEFPKVFYMSSEAPDRRGRSEGGVSSNESSWT